jgi:hypothetical protein
MTKRYALFAGQNYYPGGGWGDFCGLFDSQGEAKAFAADGGAKSEYSDSDWGQIVDLLTEELVATGDCDREGVWEWEAIGDQVSAP